MTQFIHYPSGSGGGGSSAPVIIGSSVSPVTTNGGSTLILPGLGQDNIVYIASTGGAVTSSANPQFPAGTVDGAEMTIFGTSNTDTITFVNGNGNDQNGPVTLDANNAITYIWDATASLWREESRRA